MTPIGITDHARLRIQQRGIQKEMLPLLLKYGKKTYDNYGGQVYCLNKASRERLERECGREVLRKSATCSISMPSSAKATAW